MESLELEVDQANQRFYEAFESLDIGKMNQIWAVDKPVKCVHPGWDLRSGWPAVRDSWVLIFNHTAGIRFDVTEVEIMINGELAWVTCVENVTTRVLQGEQTSNVLATNIFLRNGKKWLMVHHHGSSVLR